MSCDVALKLSPADLIDNEERLQRFGSRKHERLNGYPLPIVLCPLRRRIRHITDGKLLLEWANDETHLGRIIHEGGHCAVRRADDR